MQIINIDQLNPGDILGKSIFRGNGDLLLASGYELDPETISLMRKRGLLYVHVMNDLTKDIQPQELISDTVRHQANSVTKEAFDSIEEVGDLKSEKGEDITERLQSDKRFKNIIKMPAMKRVVSSILEEIMSNPSVMFSSLRMRAGTDGADYEHAVDTTVLCISIGQSFKYNQAELRQLGIAAMLHDTGKVILGDLRSKTSFELTADEKMLLKEHPVYSSVILGENDDGSYVEQSVVMQHHEQADGNGFPRGLTCESLPPTKANQGKSGIHRFAQILAVANTYDNLISGLGSGKIYTPEEAITAILNRRAGAWNRHVVAALTKTVQCFPVGVTVQIKDNASKRYVGYRGIISKENREEQTKPAIILTHDASGKEIAPNMVDFADEKAMQLTVDL
jgi:HD-GYP domain-containing protein (c-di-GMP phosphodiesterase class II)